MQLFRSILSNTSSQIIARIISSGTGFIITILIARYFGIGQYADIAKITAFVTLFYLVIDLGANAIFLQFEKIEQNFQEFLSFRLLLSLVVFGIIFLITLFLPYNSVTTSGYSPLVKIGILFFSLTFFSQGIIYSTTAVFQKNLSYKLAAKANILGSLITLSFVALAIFLHFPILWIIAAYIIGAFAESTLALFLLKEKISLLFPSQQFLQKIFWSTLPLTVLLFLNLIYFRIDMILLTVMKSAKDVAIYDYAYKYFDFLIALPLFLSNSLYPLLLKQEKNFRIQRKNISLYTFLFFGIGLILVPVAWLLSPLIALAKQDFSLSILPLRILILSLPIFFATNILQWIFITKKKQTFLVWAYGLSIVLNVVLNILFIPHYSYLASAIITGFSELFILIIFLLYLVIQKV